MLTSDYKGRYLLIGVAVFPAGSCSGGMKMRSVRGTHAATKGMMTTTHRRLKTAVTPRESAPWSLRAIGIYAKPLTRRRRPRVGIFQRLSE
jgi:hypothetical protein